MIEVRVIGIFEDSITIEIDGTEDEMDILSLIEDELEIDEEEFESLDFSDVVLAVEDETFHSYVYNSQSLFDDLFMGRIGVCDTYKYVSDFGDFLILCEEMSWDEVSEVEENYLGHFVTAKEVCEYFYDYEISQTCESILAFVDWNAMLRDLELGENIKSSGYHSARVW